MNFLGERIHDLHGVQGVASSNPTVPTKKSRAYSLIAVSPCSFLSPSSYACPKRTKDLFPADPAPLLPRHKLATLCNGLFVVPLFIEEVQCPSENLSLLL